MHVNAKPTVKRSIVFFLVPDFTMVAFATAIEPLRIANRMLGFEAYRWRLASFDGRPVKASNSVECAVDTSLEDERRKLGGPDRPSMVVVCSGINVESYSNKSVFAWLREEYNLDELHLLRLLVRQVREGVHVLRRDRLSFIDDDSCVLSFTEVLDQEGPEHVPVVL